MLQTRYFRELFVLLVMIAFLHLVALALFFYWSYWWYDIMMHFLGGAWVALTALWFFFYSGFIDNIELTTKNALFTAIFSILAVGIGWEIFEYINKIAVVDENYIVDTTIDFTMDFIGVFMVTWIVLKRKNSV